MRKIRRNSSVAFGGLSKLRFGKAMSLRLAWAGGLTVGHILGMDETRGSIPRRSTFYKKQHLKDQLSSFPLWPWQLLMF